MQAHPYPTQQQQSSTPERPNTKVLLTKRGISVLLHGGEARNMGFIQPSHGRSLKTSRLIARTKRLRQKLPGSSGSLQLRLLRRIQNPHTCGQAPIRGARTSFKCTAVQRSCVSTSGRKTRKPRGCRTGEGQSSSPHFRNSSQLRRAAISFNAFKWGRRISPFA